MRRISIAWPRVKRELIHERKKALREEADTIASGRKKLADSLAKVSKLRFIARRQIGRQLAEAHRKAGTVNMDARLQAAVDSFEARVNAALLHFETAFNNLSSAIITAQPDHVYEQRRAAFEQAEERFGSVLRGAEQHAKDEFRRVREEYNRA